MTPFSLAFLTDASRCPDPQAIARVLPEAGALILRDYDLPGRAALARALRAICSEHGILMLVGGDPGLAREIGADGVHLRAADLASGLRITGFNLVSAACHSMADLILARRAGASVGFLSPAFETASHPGAAALGPAQFRALAENAPLPVLALGGVDADNAAALSGKNIAGFGAIGAFISR